MEKKKWIDDQILEECTVCSIYQYLCHLHGNDYIFYIFEYDDHVSKIDDFNRFAPGHYY